MGVNIFFVLSGFLISRILINQKQLSFKNYISKFYYKRALRIFPLYYAFLIITLLLILLITNHYPLLLKLDGWRNIYTGAIAEFPYCLTYTYNLKANLSYFINFQQSSPIIFGHLWSLCLEEQFYLIFPFLVYFLSIKTLKKVTIVILILCPLLRLWGVLYVTHHITDHYWLGETFYTNIFCQSDALFTGVALSIFNFKIIKPYLTFFIVATIWLLVGIICLIFVRQAGWHNLAAVKSLGYDFPGYWFLETTKYWFINIRPFYQYTIVNVLAASLILPAINGQPLFSFIFQNRRIVYLGKISYGIYVFHFPLITLFIFLGNLKLGGWFNLTNHPLGEIMAYVLYLSTVFLIANFSYQYFEKRFLNLKHRNLKKAVLFV
jgi:peptidoglycan/LPS O-acetylase OafA/YrhL